MLICLLLSGADMFAAVCQVLIGEHIRSNGIGIGSRPRIILQPRSSGYGDVSKLKFVIHFTTISLDPNNPQVPAPQLPSVLPLAPQLPSVLPLAPQLPSVLPPSAD